AEVIQNASSVGGDLRPSGSLPRAHLLGDTFFSDKAVQDEFCAVRVQIAFSQPQARGGCTSSFRRDPAPGRESMRPSREKSASHLRTPRRPQCSIGFPPTTRSLKPRAGKYQATPSELHFGS